MSKRIQDFITQGSFCKIVLTGFTETEANNVIRCINSNIEVDQAKKFGGTNPLLLSKLWGVTDLEDY